MILFYLPHHKKLPSCSDFSHSNLFHGQRNSPTATKTPECWGGTHFARQKIGLTTAASISNFLKLSQRLLPLFPVIEPPLSSQSIISDLTLWAGVHKKIKCNTYSLLEHCYWLDEKISASSI